MNNNTSKIMKQTIEQITEDDNVIYGILDSHTPKDIDNTQCTTTTDIFHYIMNCGSMIGESSINIANIKYPFNIPSELLTCASNIILVLKGVRLAYRTDIYSEHKTKIIESILLYDQNLIMIPYPAEEPLIILKKNYEKVYKMIYDNNDPNIFFGKVLGYAYVDPDWMSSTHTIGYHLKSNNGDENEGYLYNFRLPISKYTTEIKNKVLNDLISFQEVLSEYNIKVSINGTIKLHNSFDFINFDTMVTID